MAELDHEKIRVVAYELWERDGAPDGRDDEYWHAAVKLLSDEAAGIPPKSPSSELPTHRTHQKSLRGNVFSALSGLSQVERNYRNPLGLIRASRSKPVWKTMEVGWAADN